MTITTGSSASCGARTWQFTRCNHAKLLAYSRRATEAVNPNSRSAWRSSSTPPLLVISPPEKSASMRRLRQAGNSKLKEVQFVTAKSSRFVNLSN